MSRRDDLDRLYDLFDRLRSNVGGTRTLEECTGYMDWPDRGVYFFFAPDERRDDDTFARATRVGTHAVSARSGTSLWNRLRTHRGAQRGTYEGGGNHRGSVFRKRVGEALIERDDLRDEYSEWGSGSTADRDLRLSELDMERRVSDYLRDLPFLCVALDDDPGPESDRAYVERNAIALLSNYSKEPLDPRTDEWLGRHSRSREIGQSGLWNVNHVGETYDPAFLDVLAAAVEATTTP